MLRFLLKILVLPVLLVLGFICILANLATNLSGLVFTLFLFVIGICVIICIVQANWMSLALVLGIGFAAFLLLVAIVWMQVMLEQARDSLGDFMRS